MYSFMSLFLTSMLSLSGQDSRGQCVDVLSLMAHHFENQYEHIHYSQSVSHKDPLAASKATVFISPYKLNLHSPNFGLADHFGLNYIFIICFHFNVCSYFF